MTEHKLNKKLNRDIIILVAIQTALLILKLSGIIAWSWGWIMVPCLVAVVIALFFGCAIII